MSDDHEWCRDTAREEAVRAAEDAAEWRLLRLGEVVLAGDEFQTEDWPWQRWRAVPATCVGSVIEEQSLTHRRRIDRPIQHRDLPEQVALLWASLGDILGRVVRLEGEIDAGEDATIGSGDVFADVACGSTDDEVVRLTAERDFAAGEAERLRIRVAELEQQIKLDDRWAAAAPAAAAGGVSQQEPVAWGVRFPDGKIVPSETREWAETKAKEASDRVKAAGVGVSDAVKCVPLYAAPPEPRGWLTAEERLLIESLRATFQENADVLRSDGSVGHAENWERRVRILDAILARETPPRVKVPPQPAYHDSEYGYWQTEAWKDAAFSYIEAIREAGVEVE